VSEFESRSQNRPRLRGLLWLLALAVLPLLLIGGVEFALWLNCSETRCHVTRTEGWVAFERRLDWFFPCDRDTAVYLARSLDDQATWTQLTPTDPGAVLSIEWTGPRHLRVHLLTGMSYVEQVENVAIEWVH
jgi:hypothetical protein